VWNVLDETWEADRREFLKRGGGALIAGGLLSRLIEAEAAQAAGSGVLKGTTLIIGVSSDPQTLDPERGQALRANETIKNIYAQWVRYQTRDTGRGYKRADLTKPVVGEALQSIRVTNGGRTVHCTVRRATLPSGRPLTADDFIYKVQRALGENFGSVFDFNILGIKKTSQVKKVGKYEFVMQLPHASPILGPMLRDQDAGVVDTSVVKKHVASGDPWAQKWVSLHGAPTGAYLIESWTPGSRMVLKANPRYWGAKPYFKRVVLQVIPSSDDRVLLLKNGSIDIAADLSAEAAARLKSVSGVKLYSVPSVNQDMLGFVTDKDPFSDVRLRQAIAYALPYDQLAKTVLRGEALTPKGVWPQNSIWFQKVPWPYTYNQAKAKNLLTQAGKKDGFSFTVEVSQGDADAQALAVPVQTALRQVGITMNISTLAASEFQQHLGQRSMQAWIQSNLGSYVDDPYYQCFLWFETGAVINWFKYSSAAVDKASKQLSSATSASVKKRLAASVQRQLNKDVPTISLGEPNFLMPMRDDITGFLYEPDGLLTYRLLKRKS
jgi:peptide/nickel transport system substrate-binding protein